jgi:pre-mRNA-processing factor 39
LPVPLKELDKYWAGFETYVEGRSAAAVVLEDELRAIAAEVGGAAPPPTVATGDGAEEAAAAAAAAAAAEVTATTGDPRMARFRDVRRGLYDATTAARALREPFEAVVKRPYFHGGAVRFQSS